MNGIRTARCGDSDRFCGVRIKVMYSMCFFRCSSGNFSKKWKGLRSMAQNMSNTGTQNKNEWYDVSKAMPLTGAITLQEPVSSDRGGLQVYPAERV